jgi:hypothetical protein
MSGRGQRQDSSSEHTVSVRVQLAKSREHVRLRLSGSLLVCQQRQFTDNVVTSTPVEQVRVLPPGRRATTGQCFVALVPTGFFGLLAIIALLDWLGDWRYFTLSDLALTGALFVCSAAVSTWWLRKGTPTAKLRLGNNGPVLEFWYRPGKNKRLDMFFTMLQRAQAALDVQTETHTVVRITPRKARGLRLLVAGTVSLLFLGVLAGDRIHSFWPLLLGAIPAILHVVFLFMRRRQPKALRLARSCWARGKLDEAAKLLGAFLTEHPNHLEAWHILFQVHILSSEYEDALECSNAMQSLGLVNQAEAEGLRTHVASCQEIDRRRQN